MSDQVVFLNDLPQFRHDHETHKIPLGAVVECDINVDEGCGVECIHKEGDKEIPIGIIGKVRLFVVAHTRDCDGTPLYQLGGALIAPPQDEKVFSPRYCVYRVFVRQFHQGISENDLKVVGQGVLKSFNQFALEITAG